MLVAVAGVLWVVAPGTSSTVLTTSIAVSIVVAAFFDPLESTSKRLLPSVHLAIGVLPALLNVIGVALVAALVIASALQVVFVAYRLRRGDRQRRS